MPARPPHTYTNIPVLHCTISHVGISPDVTVVVALTMVVMGLLANTVGAALPFVVTRVGLDPAIIVGPLMTTCVDTLGLLAYLGIATAYLSPKDTSPSHT